MIENNDGITLIDISERLDSIDGTLKKHTEILNENTEILKEHGEKIDKMDRTLKEHGEELERMSGMIRRNRNSIIELEDKTANPKMMGIYGQSYSGFARGRRSLQDSISEPSDDVL